MREEEVIEIFEKQGALLKGHFKLSSGLHSEKYLQCALILQYPKIAEKLSKGLAARFSSEKIDVVIGPALGGIVLSYEVGRTLGVRSVFTEREERKMVLRRGFSIAKGEKALVVEDVITTGGSTKEVIDVVKNSGGIVVGVGSIIDRSDAIIDFDVRKESLAKLQIKTFNPNSCPLCQAGIPVTKPGSRA